MILLIQLDLSTLINTAVLPQYRWPLMEQALTLGKSHHTEDPV